MERPAGVTILAVVAFIFGGLLALGGLGMMLGGAVLSRMANSGGLGMLAGVGGAIIGFVFLGFAVVYIVDAIGLLKVANWARILTIILVGLSLLRSAFSMMRSLGHLNPIALCFALIIAAIDVWILVYLFKPDVKQAFGAASF
jgi:cytochrome c oxidase subunit IV